MHRFVRALGGLGAVTPPDTARTHEARPMRTAKRPRAFWHFRHGRAWATRVRAIAGGGCHRLRAGAALIVSDGYF